LAWLHQQFTKSIPLWHFEFGISTGIPQNSLPKKSPKCAKTQNVGSGGIAQKEAKTMNNIISKYFK
jgi:hypothetical protein